MVWLPNNDVTTVLVLIEYTNVTDGQTDRRMDGPLDRHCIKAVATFMHGITQQAVSHTIHYHICVLRKLSVIIRK